MNEMATFNYPYAQGQYNTLPATDPQFNARLDYGYVQHGKPLLRFEGRLYQDIGPGEEESALGMTLPQPGYLGAAQVVDVMRASSATTSSAARPKKLRTEQDDYYLPRVCLTKAEMDAIRACHTKEPKRAFRGKPANHKGWIHISLPNTPR
ncbi:uncharacterized protein PAC_11804 [Phialocephala subalpina]|uniref:Uncharacterized protein n=1 Tax=Phialocephala subalpina TaxID=576137 RepID=A0A1L7XAA6_9HELO|nr:uncharacterized protein PAC_11804 [Phialocephala subalpina]